MSGPLVAVVEDEFLIAIDIVEALERAGFRARYAASSRLAMKQACEGEFPSALVADVHLGRGGDGITLAQRFRELSKSPLVVVFSTGNADIATRERAAQCSPAAYLLKPSNPAMIIAALRSAFPIEGGA